MAFLGFLGFVLFITAVVLPIYLLFSLRALRHRVDLILQNRPTTTEDITEEPTVEPVKSTSSAADIVAQARAKAAKKAKAAEREDRIAAARVTKPDNSVSQPSPLDNFVFNKDNIDRVTAWMQKNWFFAVAAVSLALAGVFLVQYGVENGLLSPELRVIGALTLGAILIAIGEYIRRKIGSDEDGTFALLPSAFSGAGLVSIFAAVLAARLMYDLIGANFAFISLAATGVLAVILGWFYGPLLAVMGVFGALVAPFIVGGDSENAHFLQLYFAGIAMVALGIDTIKRWAWLSSLGLIGAYGAAIALYPTTGDDLNFIAFAVITALAAAAIPMRSLLPAHDGPMLTSFLTVKKGDKVSDLLPDFPTRLAAGAFITSGLVIALVGFTESSAFWLTLGALSLLFFAAIYWMEDADALSDLAFLPAALAFGLVAWQSMMSGRTYMAWVGNKLREQLDFASPILAILLGGALVFSLLFAWRSYFKAPLPRLNAAVAAGFAPLFAVMLEVLWLPDVVLGSGNWALYLAVIAVAMTLLAERFSRIDTADRMRTALFALSAMSMLSFVLVVLLGQVALTVSLAVMVMAAAWLGARFNLPLLDRYVQVGAVAVSYRLVIDPGINWAMDAPIWEATLAFAAVIMLLAVAFTAKRKQAGADVAVVLESAIWTLSGIFISLMLIRYFDYIDSTGSKYTQASLVGMVWLLSSANQIYRIRATEQLRRTRITLSSIYLLAGTVFLGIAVTDLNPLNQYDALVLGWPVLNSLAVAYLLPALFIGAVAYWFDHLNIWLRRALGFIASGLGALYIGLEIRHWWQGDKLSGSSVLDGELYSYTVAMMLAAIVLLVLAFIRQSPLLRRIALVGVGLTVAKVFFVDAAELDGLLRVVSFLILGLVAAAMAWVNRILQINEAKE